MNLNREDPVHVALIELAFAAAKLVEDLHDYQHFLGGRDDWPFSLRDIEQHYTQVMNAWEQFHAAMSETSTAEPLKPEEGDEVRLVEPRETSE